MKNLIFFISIALFHINSLLASQKMYQIVDLGLQDYSSSNATSINNKGQVCGTGENENKKFIFVWDTEYKLNTTNIIPASGPLHQ